MMIYQVKGNILSQYNFLQTPRKFMVAKLFSIMISSDEDPSLWIESLAIVNLRGISTKLYYD